MRICRSCGRENPDESDFCTCGEYLRWEPTNYLPSVAAPEDAQANGAAPEAASGAGSAAPASAAAAGSAAAAASDDTAGS